MDPSFLPNNFVGHSSGFRATLVGPSCGTLLWDTHVRRSCCETLLWDILAGALLQNNLVGQFCGTRDVLATTSDALVTSSFLPLVAMRC